MVLVIFLQFLITLFFAGGLFFKAGHLKNKTIGIYLLLFAFELAYFVYGTSGIPAIYPIFVGRLYYSIGLLYGPLLWLHYLSIVTPERRLHIKDLIHLLPVLIVNIHMLDILLLPDKERMAFFYDQEQFLNRIMIYNYLRAAHQIFYGALLVYGIKRSINTTEINDRFYLIGITIIYTFTTIVITLLTLFANSWYDFAWYYLVCTSFVGLIGYVLYVDPKFFKAIKAKYQHSSFTQDNMQQLAYDLEQLMQNKALFLDNNLTVDEVAQVLGVKSHQISQTLSSFTRENFNDYINKYRIDHAKRLLKSKAHAPYKIEAIALESGFNNKVTFYSAFRKFTNTTPSKYRKEHREV
ncbi:MAG: helix-turn-helix domain-containing protein [Dokdonia sp.]